MAGFHDSRGSQASARAAPSAPTLPFPDRRAAGRELSSWLADRLGGRADLLVLGLPRGGVPVAFEVAEALNAPLDVFVVRKLGVPGREELAFGAVASGGVRVLNDRVVRSFGVPPEEVDRVAAQALREVQALDVAYRDGAPALPAAGRTVVVVDDGLATGATMRAAVQALRALDPRRLVVAVPVAPADACDELRALADEVVCVATPEPFAAVGLWYQDFAPVSSEEVRQLLRLRRAAVGQPAG